MKKLLVVLALAFFAMGINAQNSLWPYDEVSPTATDTLLVWHNDSTKVITVGEFLWANGLNPLTADWDVGAHTITGLRYVSDVATGTAPFTVASQTVVINLNADLLDGQSGAYYLDNATHTSEVTGSEALTIADDVIEAANLESTNSASDNYIPSYDLASGGFTWVANGGGSSVITDLTGTAWRIVYTDGSGDVTELALGTDGQVLQSNGASSAPSWEASSATGLEVDSITTDGTYVFFWDGATPDTLLPYIPYSGRTVLPYDIDSITFEGGNYLVWDLGDTVSLYQPLFASGSAGQVPASGGGTTNFLRADGTWAEPPGGGGGDIAWTDTVSTIATKYDIDTVNTKIDNTQAVTLMAYEDIAITPSEIQSLYPFGSGVGLAGDTVLIDDALNGYGYYHRTEDSTEITLVETWLPTGDTVNYYLVVGTTLWTPVDTLATIAADAGLTSTTSFDVSTVTESDYVWIEMGATTATRKPVKFRATMYGYIKRD